MIGISNNPLLGSIRDGLQEVTVYDHELGNKRSLNVTPEEADKFVKERNENIKSASRQGWKIAGIISAVGAFAGAGVNSIIALKMLIN